MAEKQEVLFVTALFNINRKDWKSYARSQDTYLDYFKTWARLDNHLVAYFDSEETAQKALDIRKSFGREEKTEVIVVDYKAIDSNLLSRIEDVASNPIQQSFHIRTDSPEAWNALYVYVMFLKGWCMKEAARNHPEYNTLSWIDFGLGRGNDIFAKPEEFNFTFKTYAFDKIMFHPIKEIHNISSHIPIFDLVKSGDTYICGGYYMGPNALWQQFFDLTYRYLNSMLDCGFIDDDQTLLFMVCRNNPDIAGTFNANPNRYETFCKLADNRLTLTKQIMKESRYSMLVARIIQIRQCIIYAFKTLRRSLEPDVTE